ncbi:Serine/threonine-specific protein phosphatase/bis(5-nucleosyl)-tetraphosphatase [Arabidopsis thaliana x Arabidopsis arenosa]|uniref:Serine/threonine-specific protein phosphatase/bis(5-nucleosyl)-tetraphosphatase n=1 Tax=Arabidopsis thaliana x Arabidopsis arenosa TaxID=1240361 RepID=A0A8T1YUR7_9BRAS|nr:Serine/threonine-specific protein phosphatase/bis(5-nucleosyl)-tetraphosphatase [Arabidopsis thaliana x Arabidopsis arenosa]
MPPPEISKRVLDAKLEACKFAFLKLSAVKTTRMKNYKQLRTLLMLKEISRRGADRDFLKDPENSVTRILCSVLKQVVSNSDRSLKSLRGFQYETLDDQEKQQVTRMIASVQGMGSRKYEPETVDHLEDMTEPVEMEIYLGNGDDSVGGDFGDIVLEPISWPLESQLNLEWVETLMGLINQFTWKNSVSEFPLILPHSVAFPLVECASQILDKEANCVKLDCCSENSRVIVVGDLHGQLHDLLKIFDQSGRPSPNQCFVFNGNYIGRGSWSLEVFLVLLAWKILMPENVILLRGSSETRVSAEELDFLKEICDRYGEHGPMLYSKCIDCFKMLPLASVISNSVYTTHGGLFQSSRIQEDSVNPSLLLGSLDELDKIERRQAGENDDENITLNHVLWSCPWMADGLSESNYKGLLWGADCTETFLQQSNLKMIIRSHEGPDARADREDMGNMLSGYSIDHEVESGKLCTVFSASMISQGSRNYENEGAYAVLEPHNFTEPRFVSYTVENVPRLQHQIISDGSSTQQQQMWENRTGHGFASMGISNPPSWTVPLPNDPSQILQLRESPQVFEGLPLPDTIQEPHKSNYDYLFRLISALKQEIQTRDNREKELMDHLTKTKATLEVISQMSSSL